MNHPIDSIEWIDPAELRPNDWNPNQHTPDTLDLLYQSLLTDGWTHPILATQDGTIIDGQHRWQIATERVGLPDKVPVVRIRTASESDLIAATVRHNRARGQHTAERMAPLIQRLEDQDGQPEHLIGMDAGEARLFRHTLPALTAAAADYSPAWNPAENE